MTARTRPEPMPERLPPHDTASEQAVIAGVLLYPEAYQRVAPILKAPDFWDDRNRAIYVAASAVAPATVITVRVELERINLFELAGGDDYLFEVTTDFTRALTYEASARLVADLARRRALISAGQELVRAAYTGIGLEGALAAILEQRGGLAATTAPLLLDWAAFWTRERTEEDWLLEPLFPRGRSISIYSAPGLGKSLLALDCAARLATGRRVLDQPAGEPVSTLMLDYEMTEDDVYERLSAMGFGADVDLSCFHYALLPALPPLDTTAGGAAVVQLAQSVGAAVVFIDTTSRVISGKENDSDTILGLYRHTVLPLKALGCTIVRLDHPGKNLDLGSRGTSAKKDDVDLAWILEPREGGMRLKAEKRRQSWIPEYVDLVKLEDPLRHERADESWPPGTHALAETLDRLGVPEEWGSTKVRAAVRDAGIKARNDAINAAIRYRKTGHNYSKSVRDRSPDEGGDRSRGPVDNQVRDRYGDRSGPVPAADGDRVPPLKGGPVPADRVSNYQRACLEPGCIGTMTRHAGGMWVCDYNDFHRTTGD